MAQATQSPVPVAVGACYPGHPGASAQATACGNASSLIDRCHELSPQSTYGGTADTVRSLSNAASTDHCPAAPQTKTVPTRAVTARWPAKKQTGSVARLCSARSGTLTGHFLSLPLKKEIKTAPQSTERCSNQALHKNANAIAKSIERSRASIDHCPAGPHEKR